MFAVSKFLQSMSDHDFYYYYEEFPSVIREVLGLSNQERTDDSSIYTFLFSSFSRDAGKYTNGNNLLMKVAVTKLVNDLPNVFKPWGITIEHSPKSIFNELSNKYKKIMKLRGVEEKLANKAADDLIVVIVRDVIGRYGGQLFKVNRRGR
ncbi:hypothetical protein [Shimazuella alba]|uniref:Uncharacterized protein n=1 Tax=Shimazuella alba TaxID=2690964 RepID=A0A6I4VRA8_9BACL|nr:hypothetical protein [Shimazuella alba]MXQ52416.1 hypothetical protein [Shimazuella alba]